MLRAALINAKLVSDADFLTPLNSLLDGTSCVVGTNDFLVSPTGPASMGVSVGTGWALVYSGSKASYIPVQNDAAIIQAITSNSSGSTRIDLICLKVDTTVTSDATGDNVPSIQYVTGTPGSGQPATPAGYELLATVTVVNGASSISAGNITDKRAFPLFVSTIKTGLLTTTQYAPQGFLINGKISVSVASNNITVAIKGTDGNDPSASNPVYCRIGDTVRTITTALSVTKNAGTNWFNAGSAELATQEIDYFVYLGYNATDGVVIGFARIIGRKYGDFSATTTNEKYAAISTITNASSSDYYEVIGRFAATLSATASFNWSVPTFTATNLIQRPIFETRILAYIPTQSGSAGSVGTATQTDGVKQYQVRDGRCWLALYTKITNKGSWSGTFRIALPFTNLIDNSFFAGALAANNTNPETAGRGKPHTATGYINFISNIDTAELDWATVAVNDEAMVNGEYAI